MYSSFYNFFKITFEYSLTIKLHFMKKRFYYLLHLCVIVLCLTSNSYGNNFTEPDLPVQSKLLAQYQYVVDTVIIEEASEANEGCFTIRVNIVKIDQWNTRFVIHSADIYTGPGCECDGEVISDNALGIKDTIIRDHRPTSSSFSGFMYANPSLFADYKVSRDNAIK